jgi:ribosome-binding protein aMBF1 (putative translation factor)
LLGYSKRTWSAPHGTAVKKFPALDRAIREQIATAREASGMSQRELCDKLRRRNNYIQNIESGVQSVGAAELHVIARACGSTGPDLLARAVQAADK